MALPASPSVVVLENDQSIYTPNTQSSVVGIIGFADKGPTNTATLITSQNQLLNVFGKPDSGIPGQGLEGALEILEATNQLYFVRAAGSGAANATGSATLGFCPAVAIPDNLPSVIGSSLYYSVVDNAGVTQVTNTITLTSSVNATTNSEIFLEKFDNEVYGDQPVAAVADSTGQLFLVSRYAGNLARLTVSGVGLGFSGIGVSGQFIASAASVTASGGTFLKTGSSALYAYVASKYPGTGYSLLTLRDGSIQGVSVEVENKSVRDNFIVNSEGTERERFSVELSPSSPASIEFLLTTDELNNTSDYVTVEIESSATVNYTLPDNFADKISTIRQVTFQGATTSGTPRFVKLVEGTTGLTGGNSGYSTTETGTNADFTGLIGNQAAKSGMYALDDDGLNISIAAIPGISDDSVQNALINLAETSKNFVAVVAPPYSLDNVQEAVDWMNGRKTRTSPINSSYAAVYWPWVQVFNYFAGADEWYDPAIFAVRQYVFTDSVAEPWFAPAGFRRGRLTKPTDVELLLNQGDKDVLYLNNINPIVKELQSGIAVLGQKTAQRAPTALDRVNVRRLMIYVRKVLLQLGRPFQFEPNDVFTWELVEAAITPFLDDLKARRAITEGAVKCDATTNTSLRVDRNELWCSVTIKPTKAAETIVFEVNLTNQSATVNG